MSKVKVMQTWKTIDQVPEEFIHKDRHANVKNENIMDKIYKFVWRRNEKIAAAPSLNAIRIPEKYSLNIDLEVGFAS